MSPADLKGKGLTQRDVIRQALKPEQLGSKASAEAIREWVEWTFPTVTLDETFSDEVERMRREAGDCC